ncbi:MAG TPA: DMT family transporter [Gemmatimonadales bacterium]|nr:DMT family transporter [Gemmatimonadales bacterium]
MNPRQLAALLFLAAVWGASFLFIRVAAPVLGPFPLMAGRVLIAAGALWLIGRARRLPVALRPYWRQLLVLGLVHAAAPFALIAIAEIRLTASMAAVLIAAQPLLAALIGGSRFSFNAFSWASTGAAGSTLLQTCPRALSPNVPTEPVPAPSMTCRRHRGKREPHRRIDSMRLGRPKSLRVFRTPSVTVPMPNHWSTKPVTRMSSSVAPGRRDTQSATTITTRATQSRRVSPNHCMNAFNHDQSRAIPPPGTTDRARATAPRRRS